MTVKPWAGFIADFPDDQVETERDIEVFGGRNVAVAIGEILTGLGCKVSSPDYAEVKGWEFDFYDEADRRFWCQVTSFHPAFWLLFEDPALTRETKAKNATAYAEMWRKLARVATGMNTGVGMSPRRVWSTPARAPVAVACSSEKPTLTPADSPRARALSTGHSSG